MYFTVGTVFSASKNQSMSGHDSATEGILPRHSRYMEGEKSSNFGAKKK